MKAERRAALVEAIALGLSSALPLVPYFARLVATKPARYVVEGDYAGLELATRFVFSGRTLLGPYSRFEFNHPGPAYFYFLAPVYEAFGGASKGIYAGACVINLLAAFAIAFAVRLYATRAHAIGAALAVIAWTVAFGNATPLPWNPLVVVLPLLAFLVFAALFSTGRASAAPFAMAFGLFVAETHLSTIPTVAVGTVAALAAFVLRRRRGAELSTRDRRFLWAALGVFALLVAPMIVEQLTAREGNMTKLARFFLDRREPLKGLGECVRAFVASTSWLPDGLMHPTLAAGGPRVMASEPIEKMSADAGAGPTIALGIASVVALVVAWRRRDGTSVALGAFGIGASLLAVLALRNVIGPMFQYLVFWITASTTMAWLGVLVTASSALATRRPAAIAVVLAAAFSTTVQSKWLEGNRIALDAERQEYKDLHDALVKRMRERGETPVIHRDAAWYMALSLADELAKDGLDARVEERERWILGRQLRTPTGVAKVVHVYTQTAALPLPWAACTELVATSGGTELRVSPFEVRDCPLSPTAP